MATSASLLIFFVLAMQCLPTLVVVAKETGSWRWPLLQFCYMTIIAYTAALFAYRFMP
jgi:ferrous iron transport protein B